MRTTELIKGPQEDRVGVSLGHELFCGYEQRLIQWGCFNCGFYEKRVFTSGVISEDLDVYIVCRFGEEPIDLIGEVAACPKGCRPQATENKTKSLWASWALKTESVVTAEKSSVVL